MRCKPGDLAYIVKAACAESLGRIVEVVRFEPEASVHIKEPTWWIQTTGAPLYLPTLSGKVCVQECFCEDSCLRPISGVPVHDEVTDEVPA